MTLTRFVSIFHIGLWWVSVPSLMRLMVLIIIQLIMKKRQELYSVEDVIDIKELDGKEYCLVWWEGYPKSQATWEPTQNLLFLKDWKSYYQKIKKKYKMDQERKRQSQKVESKSPLKQQLKRLIGDNENAKGTLHRKTRNEGNRYLMEQKLQITVKEEQQNEEELSLRSEDMKRKLAHQKKENQALLKVFEELQPIAKQILSESHNKEKEIQQGQNCKEQIKKDKSKGIKKQKRTLVRHKGEIVELFPVRVDLQISESKDLPFAGRDLSSIIAAHSKRGEIWYEVQFQNHTFKETAILHGRDVRLLWPRKLAQYLISKIKT